MKKDFGGRGQATVEFILVLFIAMAFIIAIIQPNADYAAASAQDVANLGKLRISADKLANAIEYVSVSGIGTRQTMQLLVPSGAVIKCEPAVDSDRVRFVYTLASGRGVAACEGDEDIVGADCNSSIAIGARFNCGPSAVVVPGTYSAIVEKGNNGNVLATLSVVQ